ncbi:MAG: Trm112 family protein [Candidatus Woesearchaeota archaeon]|nr:Trm112 family protein [Nanoarchaeota archaeon]USN44417.1 MAG: Trm112 family protein [Candidatus Woesearchaeota archaeon]
MDKELAQKIVVCRVCKGELEFQEKEAICHSCKKSYPIKNGILIMLDKEE